MKNFDLSDLVTAHKSSSNHRKLLSESENCGCFYCLEIFPYEHIEDWCDEANTALCPNCGIDSVIGSASNFPINQVFLSAMQKYWFW